MKDYTKAEEHERRVLTSLMKIFRPKTYRLSPIGSCEYWDFIMTYKKEGPYIGDIKCMSAKSTKHANIFLEHKKAKNLVYSAWTRGITKNPLYVCYYPDRVVRILDITPELLSHNPPVWTTINNKKKMVHFIPIGESRQLQL